MGYALKYVSVDWGKCSKCGTEEKLTKFKVGGIVEYLCRGCLCPDYTKTIDEVVAGKNRCMLADAEDDTPLEDGDIALFNRKIKKFGKGPVTRGFGRRIY